MQVVRCWRNLQAVPSLPVGHRSDEPTFYTVFCMNDFVMEGLHIVLHAPEIPPNTGNVIRLAANTGCILHLVEPLGFSLDAKQLRRAGLDYHDMTRVHVHADWLHCRAALPAASRVYALSTRGTVRYDTVSYRPGDILLFGNETSGLPQVVRDTVPPGQTLRLPMVPDSRSMNLSNTVAVVVFEALRQNGFSGLS